MVVRNLCRNGVAVNPNQMGLKLAVAQKVGDCHVAFAPRNDSADAVIASECNERGNLLSAPVRKNGDVMRASRRRADKARKISNIGNIAFFRNAVSPDGLAAECHRICE